MTAGVPGVRPSARARWRWAVWPAGLALLSRVFSVAVVLVETTLTHSQRLDPLTPYDATWYLNIAADGYQLGGKAANYAFYPAWPIAIRLGTLGFLPADVVAVVVANVLFVVAAVLVWRLLSERISPTAATGALALLAFAPPAYVSSLGYAQSSSLPRPPGASWPGEPTCGSYSGPSPA